jgi:hypothetical protein
VSIIRVGTTQKYSEGWDVVFSGGKKPAKSAAKPAGKSKGAKAAPAKTVASKSVAAKPRASGSKAAKVGRELALTADRKANRPGKGDAYRVAAGKATAPKGRKQPVRKAASRK